MLKATGTYLAKAAVVRPVFADGFLSEMNVRGIGNAIIELGGGRREVGQALDLSVGFSDFACIGTKLDAEAPLAVIHAPSEEATAHCEQLLLDACAIDDEPPEEHAVIYERVS